VTAAPPELGTRTAAEAEGLACHHLLVRLAGRLPDELLWRLRDWLAVDGYTALARTLPRELLRHRVGLTASEHELLAGSIGRWGARQRMIGAVLSVAEPEDPDVEFDLEFGPQGWDAVDQVLVAVVRETPGAEELRRSWRADARRVQRVVLVHGSDRLPVLTGTLQRVLRAQGERTPCVEVLPRDLRLPPYHQRALLASTELWRTG
jgi:hypothetical protein